MHSPEGVRYVLSSILLLRVMMHLCSVTPSYYCRIVANVLELSLQVLGIVEA
jgi:hypothetical protein